MTEQCSSCGRSYEPSSDDQRFCSKVCRKGAARNRRLSKRDQESTVVIALDDETFVQVDVGVLDDA